MNKTERHFCHFVGKEVSMTVRYTEIKTSTANSYIYIKQPSFTCDFDNYLNNTSSGRCPYRNNCAIHKGFPERIGK